MGNFLDNGKPFPKTAKELKELVGKKIKYVLERNIDKSGRGYFSVSHGTITESAGKNIWLENGDVHFWREIREYEVIEKENE